MITDNGTVIRIRADNIVGKGSLSLRAAKPILRVSLTISDLVEEIGVFTCTADHALACSLEFSVVQPRVWSVTSPFLYRASVSVAYADGTTEFAEDRFGFRCLQAAGCSLFLNGVPFYVRGYIRGAAAHEHPDLCNLSEEAYYRKNILAAKEYGFNFVRFHSAVPDETFFRVADETGILVHIEFRLPGNEYNNREEMRLSGQELAGEPFLQETIDRLYNHPSLAEYCIGNELKNCSRERIAQLGETVRRADPTRLYVDSCAWGANGRSGIDVDVQHMGYYFPFGRHAGMFEDTDNLLVCGSAMGETIANGTNAAITRTPVFRTPLIAHEVCHYTALRDLSALEEKFRKYRKPSPWWLAEERKMVEAKGFAPRYREMLRASKYFQFECWKTALEAIRRSRLLSGFHFLQFADTDRYENSNGIADCFDETEGVDREAFLQFNRDKVLLCELGSRLFFCGDEAEIPILLSDYGEKAYQTADLTFKLKAQDGTVCAEGGLHDLDLRRTGLYELCKLHLRLPDAAYSGYLRLTAVLERNGDVIAKNDWKLWAYPRGCAQPYRAFVSCEERGYMITDDIGKALCSLRAGKRVCLIYRADWTRHLLHKEMAPPQYAFRATWNRFKPVIWDRGTNYGGLCDDALLNRYGYATGRSYDFNYSVLTEDCDKIILDDFPVKVRSLVSGTDKSCRDRFDAAKNMFHEPELMYDRTLRDFSYLFELKAGDGSLLVCGMNLTGLDRNEPSTIAFCNFLKQYLSSQEFAPSEGMSVDELEAYLRRSAKSPVKERMMTQFWELDDTPVESQDYWKASYEYLLNGKAECKE